MKIWNCKIGEVEDADVPSRGDQPMRQAVREAYKKLTGRDDVFLISGWGGELTPIERAGVRNRPPPVVDHRQEIHEAISDMLDNPDKHGIYPTTKCYDRLEAYCNSISVLARQGSK